MADPQAVAILKDLTAFTEDVVKAIAIEVTANLQEATPVATGFARASWIPSLGSPSSGTGGLPESPNPAEAAAGIARIAAYKLTDGKVFVTNNASYIQQLARGSSSKAPAGFDRVAIERGMRDATAALSTSSTRGLRARVVSSFAGGG